LGFPTKILYAFLIFAMCYMAWYCIILSNDV
jgi:hypothetical protein